MVGRPKREAFLLDIWDSMGKVLSVAWNGDEPINIVSYCRKDWETVLMTDKDACQAQA
jgi:hypothetical protein